MRKITLLLLLLSGFYAFAQQKDAKEEKKKKMELPETVTKQAKVTINGKTIDYTVKTGYLTLKKEDGTETANIFYVAYTKNGESDITKRPLTFSFNGGPGSSSVWLHLGILGPKRVLMTDEGNSLPPPYQLVNNEYSWLDLSDFVFIDPVSTGLSRSADEKESKQFHGYSGDINSVGEFIRRYVTENTRWGSPKFLIGESYGTTRASGLSDHLQSKYGMYLNGVILVSSIMNFQTARFDKGNDLAYSLFLPTYAASAYYHKQLSIDMQSKKLEDFLDEVEKFAQGEYTVALMQGDLLSSQDRQNIVSKLVRYTGLDKSYIERANLRINIHSFRKELLRENLEVFGRFDSRYKIKDMTGNAEFAELDPSYQPTISGPFSTGLNDYLSREIGFKSELPYEILTGRVQPWDYGNAQNQYLNTSEALRQAMNKNPHLQVWIANGYYDLATPYFATEYTVAQMGLDSELRKNIWMTYYEAGHMMYLHKVSLVKMKKDAEEFFKKALNK